MENALSQDEIESKKTRPPKVLGRQTPVVVVSRAVRPTSPTQGRHHMGRTLSGCVCPLMCACKSGVRSEPSSWAPVVISQFSVDDIES